MINNYTRMIKKIGRVVCNNFKIKLYISHKPIMLFSYKWLNTYHGSPRAFFWIFHLVNDVLLLCQVEKK